MSLLEARSPFGSDISIIGGCLKTVQLNATHLLDADAHSALPFGRSSYNYDILRLRKGVHFCSYAMRSGFPRNISCFHTRRGLSSRKSFRISPSYPWIDHSTLATAPCATDGKRGFIMHSTRAFLHTCSSNEVGGR